MKDTGENLLHGVLEKNRRAIARAISRVENEHADARQLLHALFGHTGRAYRVGITGPPGAGKSTLTNRLAGLYRRQDRSVGIIAVDPTSPFTGGALLGDRVRMTDVEMDEGVFIRSMASRGSLGGLSRKAKEAADVLDAAGFDIVLMETVGVGQSELEVAGACDTTVVVLVPESGDGIQAMKAGLMEIADLFVMNKADRPGAEQAVQSIRMVLGFRSPSMPGSSRTPDSQVDVLMTVASEGKGLEALVEALDRRYARMERSGELLARREKRLEARVRELVEEQLKSEFWNEMRMAVLRKGLDQVVSRQQTPYELAARLLEHFRSKS